MPADTKSDLLDSAENTARARGFDGFSYADLAQDVGIRKASIQRHFSTKAALSVALMQRYHTAIQDACTEMTKTSATGGARLAGLISLYQRAMKGGKTLCLVFHFRRAETACLQRSSPR